MEQQIAVRRPECRQHLKRRVNVLEGFILDPEEK
jgi:hypothetical protein